MAIGTEVRLKCRVPAAFDLSLEGLAFKRLGRLEPVIVFLGCEALLNTLQYFHPQEARVQRVEEELAAGALVLGIIGLREDNAEITHGRHRLLALRLAGRTSVPFLTDRSMASGLQLLFGQGSDQHVYDLSGCQYSVV